MFAGHFLRFQLYSLVPLQPHLIPHLCFQSSHYHSPSPLLPYPQQCVSPLEHSQCSAPLAESPAQQEVGRRIQEVHETVLGDGGEATGPLGSERLRGGCGIKLTDLLTVPRFILLDCTCESCRICRAFPA